MEPGRNMHAASSHAPSRNSVPELTPGKVNRGCVLLRSILMAAQVSSLGSIQRMLGGPRALIYSQRGSIVQHPARARPHRRVTLQVRMDSAVQMVESAFRLKLQRKYLPCPTGPPKDTSHVATLLLALHGHPRTLLGVAQHQEN
jgi:hypothetical protein